MHNNNNTKYQWITIKYNKHAANEKCIMDARNLKAKYIMLFVTNHYTYYLLNIYLKHIYHGYTVC